MLGKEKWKQLFFSLQQHIVFTLKFKAKSFLHQLGQTPQVTQAKSPQTVQQQTGSYFSQCETSSNQTLTFESSEMRPAGYMMNECARNMWLEAGALAQSRETLVTNLEQDHIQQWIYSNSLIWKGSCWLQ